MDPITHEPEIKTFEVTVVMTQKSYTKILVDSTSQEMAELSARHCSIELGDEHWTPFNWTKLESTSVPLEDDNA